MRLSLKNARQVIRRKNYHNNFEIKQHHKHIHAEIQIRKGEYTK